MSAGRPPQPGAARLDELPLKVQNPSAEDDADEVNNLSRRMYGRVMADIWWQRGVIYQIYPRSFQDCDGDGIGDLGGILQRLDYCASFGVDALWLSPIYPSPMADFGYDISDYTDIHPIFGTLAEFDRLLAEIKRRGMKLLLDYVPNHTSEEHPWFRASRSGGGNAKRDWYLWHDPAPDGGPPNNWLSHFGGSAWEWDAHTGQYYYHSFLKNQPDLNWRHPEVIAAMHDVLRFWLKRGVDGFRVDVLWLLIKDDQWRDNPANPDYRPGMPPQQCQPPLYTADRPEVQSIVAGLRKVIDEFDAKVLIGEIYLPVDRPRPASLLSLYRCLLQLRRSHASLSSGKYVPLLAAGDLLAYIRCTENERLLIALNLGAQPCPIALEALRGGRRTLLSTYLDHDGEGCAAPVALRPNEGVIIDLAPRPS